MHSETALKGLLAFAAIAEHGSINGAARALNVSQPSLSRTLQQLEATIGAPLFERRTKGVVLNELGRQLLAHAQLIRAETINAARTIETFQRGKRRQLHIGAVTTHPLVQFAEAIIDFMGHEPNLFLRISHGSLEELMEMLRQGMIEMVFGPLIPGPDGNDLVQDIIYHDVVHIYCSPNCPLAGAGRVSLDDLSAGSWVLPPAGSAARRKVSELFTEAGLPEPTPAIEVENVPMRRALVMRSEYLSVFHDHHVHDQVDCGLLKKVDLDWKAHVGAIGSLRIAPHTPTSLRLLRAFKGRYGAAGFACSKDAQEICPATSTMKPKRGAVYVRH